MIKERVVQLVENKGIPKEKFYRDIGMTSASFRGKARLTPLNSEAIENILSLVPDANAEWLLTGQGEMYKHKQYRSEPAISMVAEDHEPYLPAVSRHQGVPYFDVDFMGGFDLLQNDQTTNPSFYIDFPPYNDCFAWVNVTGKSMSPFISHGDIIALKEEINWKKFLLSGEIYAIVTEGFRTIKKVKVEDDVDYFTLIPQNTSPEFAQQRLPKSLVRKVYWVKGAVKKFF